MPQPHQMLKSKDFQRGLPALVVGLACILLIGYGTFIQPMGLVEEYNLRLADELKRYRAATESGRETAKLTLLAEQIDLRIRRLDRELSPVAQDTQLDFYVQHCKFLREIPAPETVDQSQLTHFEAQLANLTAAILEDDQASQNAILLVAAEQANRADSRFLAPTIARLEKISRSLSSNHEGKQQLAKLLLKRVWIDASKTLRCQPNLAELGRIYELASALDDNAESKAELLARCQIFLATDSAFVEPAQEINQSRQWRVLRNCGKANWRAVASGLRGFTAAEQPDAARKTGEFLSQILLSKFPEANGDWCTAAPQGIELLLQLNKNAPAFHAFVWSAALNRAGREVGVSSSLVEALVIDASSNTGKLVLATSEIIAANPKNALNQLKRSGRVNHQLLELFAQQAIWYAQRDSEHLAAFEEVVAELIRTQSPDASLLFAGGVIALKLQNFQLASERLEDAKEVTGQSSVIDELLSQIRSQQVPQ